MQPPPCRIRSADVNTRKVLVIEPDKTLRDVMANCLRSRQYEVIETSSPFGCFKEIADEVYDLVIVDIDLPDQDGLVLVSSLRKDSICRLLLVSDRLSLAERLKAYEAGADVIMSRQFDPRELAAAAAGLMQRLAPRLNGSAAIQNSLPPDYGWELVRAGMSLVTPFGESVSLTRKELAFLEGLAMKPGRVVSREYLLDLLHYEKDKSGYVSLNALVYRLRRKISGERESPIKTIAGAGYAFSASILVG